MYVMCNGRIETEEERNARVKLTLAIIDEICRECDCTPLDIAAALGVELTGAKIVN